MTIREVLQNINEALESEHGIAMYKSAHAAGQMRYSNPEYWVPRKWEYWGKSGMKTDESTWPTDGRLHVSLVSGNSEGYYLHVDNETQKGCDTLLLGKILGPIEDGFPVLLALTKMFDWSRPKTCVLPD